MAELNLAELTKASALAILSRAVEHMRSEYGTLPLDEAVALRAVVREALEGTSTALRAEAGTWEQAKKKGWQSKVKELRGIAIEIERLTKAVNMIDLPSLPYVDAEPAPKRAPAEIVTPGKTGPGTLSEPSGTYVRVDFQSPEVAPDLMAALRESFARRGGDQADVQPEKDCCSQHEGEACAAPNVAPCCPFCPSFEPFALDAMQEAEALGANLPGGELLGVRNDPDVTVRIDGAGDGSPLISALDAAREAGADDNPLRDPAFVREVTQPNAIPTLVKETMSMRPQGEQAEIETSHEDPFTDPAPTAASAQQTARVYTWADLAAPLPADAPTHWSWSQLETSADCGAKYRLQRIEHAPQVPQWSLVGGNAVHAFIAEYERVSIEHNGGKPWMHGVDQTIAARWSQVFHAEIATVALTSGLPMTAFRAANKGAEGYTWWLTNGEDMCRTYVTAQVDRSWSVFESLSCVAWIEHEVAFHVPTRYGPVLFKAILDQVRREDGLLTIVDFKSGARAPADTLQLSSQGFALATAIGHDGAGIKAQYYDARHGTYTDPIDACTQAAWEELCYRVDQEEAKRRAGLFPLRVSGFCNSCSVSHVCPKKGQRS